MPYYTIRVLRVYLILICTYYSVLVTKIINCDILHERSTVGFTTVLIVNYHVVLRVVSAAPATTAAHV